MPISLTVIPAGAIIDAATLRDRLQTTETYLNEQIAQADRDTGWMQANHVYRPDFFGGSNPHTTLTTGESYFRERPVAEERRAFFSYYLGEGPYIVPGLAATIQIPETLTPSFGKAYRLVVTASFYVFEFGGADAYLDEDTYRAAKLDLILNGEAARSNSMVRWLYKGSITSANQAVAFYPRKQISLTWGDTSAPTPIVGCNSVGISVSPTNPGVTEYWKHLVFQQSNLVARYFLR